MASTVGGQGGQQNYEKLFHTELKAGEGAFSKTRETSKLSFKALKIGDKQGNHKLHHLMSRILTPITALFEKLTESNERLSLSQSTGNAENNKEVGPNFRQRNQIRESVTDYTNNLRDVSKQIKAKQNEIKKIEKQIAYGESSLVQLETFDTRIQSDSKKLPEALEKAKSELAQITQEWVQVRPNVEDLKSALSNSVFSGSTLLVRLNRAERKIDQTLLHESVQDVNSFLNREAVTEVRGLLKNMPEGDPKTNGWNAAIEASLGKIAQAKAAYASLDGADKKPKTTDPSVKFNTAADVVIQKEHLVRQLKNYPFGICQLKEKTQEGKYDSDVIKTNMSYVRNVVEACLLQPPGDPFAKEVAKRVFDDLKGIRANLHAELAGSRARAANQDANQFLVEVEQWIDDLNNKVINGRS